MDSKLRNNHEFQAFRRQIEHRIARLDREIFRLKMKQTLDATGRTATFSLGLILFTGMVLIFAFAKDWT